MERDQPGEQRIDQKDRDGEKYRGNISRVDLDFAELVAQKPIGRLIRAAISTRTAIRGQNTIQDVDDLGLRGRSARADRQVVERALHLKRRGQRIEIHP